MIVVFAFLALSIAIVITHLVEPQSRREKLSMPASTVRVYSSLVVIASLWVSILPIISVILWIRLPGSRSLFQVFIASGQGNHSDVEIQYTYLSEVDMGSRYSLCCAGLFAEYTRSLLSQGEFLHSPTDCWGNVKIPDLSRLGHHSADDQGWIAVPSERNVTYSSLMGVPTSGVPDKGNTTFTIETSYYIVECQNVTIGKFKEYWILDVGQVISDSPIYNGPFSETNTTFGLDSTASFSLATAGFQRRKWPQRWEDIHNEPSSTANLSKSQPIEPQPLLVQSTYYGSSIQFVRRYKRPTVSAYCTLKMQYVSVNISCITPISCTATAIRSSRIPHPNTNATDFGHIRAFYEFTRQLLIAGRDGHAAVDGSLIDGNTLTEYFLQNPYFGSHIEEWGIYGPYSSHPGLPSPEQYASRLQMVLNGFRMLQMGNTKFRISPAFNNSRSTKGHNVVGEGVYRIRVGRTMMLILVSGMLELAAVVNVAWWWERWT